MQYHNRRQIAKAEMNLQPTLLISAALQDGGAKHMILALPIVPCLLVALLRNSYEI
jgi:hypothetical protein